MEAAAREADVVTKNDTNRTSTLVKSNIEKVSKASGSSSGNLDHLESQVSEVTHLLKNNVEKVVARGERIDDLQTRSEELQVGASNFSRRATQVRRRMCWQNFRLNCIIALVVLGIVLVIVVVVLVELKPWEKSGDSGHNATRHN